MKVLHIFSGYGGGISSLVRNLIENKEDDFAFDVMTFSFKGGDDFIKSITESGGTCYTMPRPRIDGTKAFNAFVDKVMSENNYDAVHCHITGWSALPFARAAKKNHIEHFVLHAHTTTYDRKIDRLALLQCVNRWINYRISDAYFTCSDLAASYIYGAKYLKKRSAVLIPNGINEEKYACQINADEIDNYKREFGINSNDKVILHVGRFSPPKNHFFILQIAEKLRDSGFHFKMLLVGDGELFDSIDHAVQNKGLSKNVKLIGRRNDIGKLMQFSDLMILPSFYEGLPTVAVECEASGCPALLADTITKQCDMKLGLVSFWPLDNADLWMRAIVNNEIGHQQVKQCIDSIRNQGFTARMAGRLYCKELARMGERK